MIIIIMLLFHYLELQVFYILNEDGPINIHPNPLNERHLFTFLFTSDFNRCRNLVIPSKDKGTAPAFIKYTSVTITYIKTFKNESLNFHFIVNVFVICL